MNQPTSLAEGRYLLVEKLGEGGMATVYRAFDQRLQVWRAVKILSPDYADKKKIAKRFEAEAQTMALLEHKNIVRVYDVGRDANIAYIVMELVEGGCLVDWLEHHGRMPPRLAIDATIEVCEGLAAAHDKGVIHRDIKPHNVMIARDGVCRVTDFGIARVGDSETSLTKTGSVMGTWGYMAPEQRTNAKGVDVRADVYAVGATLYSLLTDRMPMDLFAADRDSSMLEGVHELLVPLLVRTTDYDRDRRFATVRDLRDALIALRPELPENPPSTPPLALEARAAPPVPDPTKYVSATELSQRGGTTRATILPGENASGTDPAPTILPDGDFEPYEPAGGRIHAMTLPPEEVAVTQPGSMSRQNRPVFQPGALPSGAGDDEVTDHGDLLPIAAAPVSTASKALFGATAAIWVFGGGILLVVLGFFAWRAMQEPTVVADPVPVPAPVDPQPVGPQPIVPQPVDPQPQPVDPQPIDPQPMPVGPQPVGPRPQPVVPQPVVPQPVVLPQPVEPVPVPAPVPVAAKPCVKVSSVEVTGASKKTTFRFEPCNAVDALPDWNVVLHYRNAGDAAYREVTVGRYGKRWTVGLDPPPRPIEYFAEGWGGDPIGSASKPRVFTPPDAE